MRMRPIVTDVTVCLSVCLLVTTVSPTEAAELIEVLFGVRNRVGQRNEVLAGGRDLSRAIRGTL